MSDPGRSTKHCQNCGAEVRPGDYVCENCGAFLAADPAPAPPDYEQTPEQPAAGSPETPTPQPPPAEAPEPPPAEPERPDATQEDAAAAENAPQDAPEEAPRGAQPGVPQGADTRPGPDEPAGTDEWIGSGRGGFIPAGLAGQAPVAGGRAGAFGGGGALLVGASPVRQVVAGVALAVGTVVLSLVFFYLLMTIRWLIGVSGAPGLNGIFVFVAAHGGAISGEIPQTPALLGLGGSVTVDLPLTTLALLPFLVLLAGSWALGRRVGAALPFVGVLGIVYAVLLMLSALVGGTSTELGQGVELSVSAAPLSAALHGFLIAAAGGLVGVMAARGPLLPDRARQVVKGALVAVLVSVVLTALISILLSVVVSVPENPLQDLQSGQPADAQGAEQPSEDGGGGFGALLATIGSFVALLPAGVGTVWLLAHGIPIGLQNAPDLGNLPGAGAALQNATLSAGLISNWPFSGAWRLLLIAPVVGLIVGGAVAARGAGSPQRLLYGAFVAVPYFAVVLLTAIMMRIGLSASVGPLNIDTALGAALFPWTLLVLPVAAIFATAGALLARPGAIPVPRPGLAGSVTAAVCALLLIGTLPIIAASTPEPPGPPAVGGITPGATPEATVPEITAPEGTASEGRVPDPEVTTPEQPDEPATSPEGQFIVDYYSAAARQDWAATYALLSSDSKAEFTEAEWVEKQTTYMETSGAPLVQSAKVNQVTTVGNESVVNITVTYADGSENVLPSVELVTEDGELKRRLTNAEIERVKAVQT